MTASPAFMAVTTAVTCFCLFAVAHGIATRAGHGSARWLLIGYGVCLLATLVIVAGLTSGADGMAQLLSILVALMTSACLFILYVPAVYTVLTSLSVETVVMLRRRGGAVPEAELYAHFAGRTMLERRLATLAANGYLVRDGTRFRLTPRGRAIARMFAFVKAGWKLGPGG
jgi:hypothetical protein